MTQDTVPAMHVEILALPGTAPLCLDLSDVTELDSSSLALLIALRRSEEAKAQAFEVKNVPESMKTLARLYNVEFVINNASFSTP